jgi:N6-adenosine-specific RNA methylase IME4
MGRKPIHQKPMTSAQRQKRYRLRKQRIAKGAIKRERRELRMAAMVKRTELAGLALETMTPIYNVIYADTPPKFENWSDLTGMDRAADNHYETMLIEAIKAMGDNVPAAPDCVLYLWATVPLLPAMFEVMRIWGFRYSSNIVWVKTTLSGEKLKFGTGFETRNAHEHLLVGKRGDVPSAVPGEQFPSVIVAPRRDHSVKPEIIAQKIERLYPNVPKLEMFARRHRDEWDVWGNETDARRVANADRHCTL